MKYQLTSLTLLLSCITNLISHDNLTMTNASAPDYTYDMNFTTLFLKPSSNLLYTAQADGKPIGETILSPKWHVYKIQPHYNFAFDLGAKIILHKKNSILKANWEHFLSTDDASQNAGLVTSMVGPLFQIGPDAVQYSKAHGTADYRRDKLNITYGQSIEVGQDLAINLLAGVSFNRLQQIYANSYSSNDYQTTRMVTTLNTFSGVGPELGVDLTYRIHKGLSFVSRSAFDLATGTTKNSTEYASYSPDNITTGIKNPNNQSLTVDGQLIIVPVLSQKIGVNYELAFRNHCAFQMEIGYLTQFYSNVFHSVTFASDVIDADYPAQIGLYAQTLQENISNFSLGGPYFKLEVGF